MVYGVSHAHAVGTDIGAAVGAVAGGPAGGGLGGKGVAEVIDPTREDAYWRENYSDRPYVDYFARYRGNSMNHVPSRRLSVCL